LGAVEKGASGSNVLEVASSEYWLLFFYLALALGVSFLCSLVEAVVLSVPRTHVTVGLRENRRSGRLLHEMKKNIDRPLAAILTLNTVAHTFGATGVGAQALTIFGSKWVAATSVVLTFLVLILSEIIPKTLGAVHAKKIAPAAAYIIQGMLVITWPLVVVLNTLSRLLGSSHSTGPTREEIAVVADMAEDAGVLQARESRVIRNILQLGKIKIQDVMTPRSVTFMVRKDATVEQVMERHNPLPFSRVPIYGETTDDIVAVVLRNSLQEAWRSRRKKLRLEELSVPLHAVPEVASVASALESFILRQEHIFLVVDEFGGTAGIITLEDAVETLLGVEIVDETDSVEDMRQLAREAMDRRRRSRDGDDKSEGSADGSEPAL